VTLSSSIKAMTPLKSYFNEKHAWVSISLAPCNEFSWKEKFSYPKSL